MRRKLMLAYVLVLGFIAVQAVLPQSKPPKDQPEIYLLECQYNQYGELIYLWCTDTPTLFDCNRTYCE